jgi:hypothetical protein
MFVLPDESNRVRGGGSYEKSQNNAMAEMAAIWGEKADGLREQFKVVGYASA